MDAWADGLSLDVEITLDGKLVETALTLKQDAIHPRFSVTAETVQAARDAGLQVKVWTVNTADLMQAQLDKSTTAIITDDPAVLAELLGR